MPQRSNLKFKSQDGNTNWADAMTSEINALNQYNTFQDRGIIPYLPGYKKIIIRFIFVVKHDLCHKARLVAGGHLTENRNNGTEYSGVGMVHSLSICLVVAELNGLDTMVGDVSSAYLEACTNEKVYFIAGPEFGSLQGHLFVIYKALYGLRTSGA
jgi:hypothetical protein